MADDYLDNILNPRRENSEILLARLGLDSVPSREQINREIEEKLLLPKERLRDDWLPDYQMYVL